MYADDVMVYTAANSDCDAANLPADLNALSNWSNMNGLSLNTDKCFVISFYKGNNYKLFNYFLNSNSLHRVTVIKDLGVVFNSNFTFKPLIERVITKSFKSLGFIKCSTSDFSNISAIIYLFKTTVLPNLLYCSQVWSSSIQYLRISLEAV